MNARVAFENLEDAVSAFIQACELETRAKFAQSDVCALACDEKTRARWGMTVEQVLEHLGKQARRGHTTMWARLLVGRVFPPDKRNLALSWSHHEVCARTWTSKDPDAPYRWLAYAADHELSVHRLRAAIRIVSQRRSTALPADPPAYVLDQVEAVLDTFDDRRMTIVFTSPQSLPLKRGMRLLITAVPLESDVTGNSPAALTTRMGAVCA